MDYRRALIAKIAHALGLALTKVCSTEYLLWRTVNSRGIRAWRAQPRRLSVGQEDWQSEKLMTSRSLENAKSHSDNLKGLIWHIFPNEITLLPPFNLTEYFIILIFTEIYFGKQF